MTYSKGPVRKELNTGFRVSSLTLAINFKKIETQAVAF